MSTDKFVQQMQNMERRMAEMQGRITAPAQQNLLAEVFEDFQITLEELSVAEEELRQQNQELEAERQRYEDLFEFAPDSYLVTDIAGTIQVANRAASSLLNVSQQFLVGKPIDIFFTPEVRQTFLSKLAELCSSSHVQEWEVSLQPRKSEFLNAALTIIAVRNPEGKPTALRWLLRDITDRKRAEEELIESERRFRQLAENVHEVFWMTNVSRTELIYVCPA